MSLERHDIQQENAAPYLLGALTEFEAHAFERHRDECPVCSDEVARLRPAVEALPRSVVPISPPVSLKASLMKVVEAEARERSATRRAPKRTGMFDGFRRRLASTGEGLSMRPTMAWVSASFVLAVGIMTGYAATQITSGGEDSRPLAANVDKHRVPFASGSLTVSGGESKTGILRVHGMPTLEKDSTYQVWVKRNGETISTSLFSVGQDGDGAAAVSEDLDGADAVLVTREPAGGARAPSEDPVLSVSL